MPAELDPDDPIAVLLATDSALRADGVRAAAYGGLALAVYGEPRETKDADLAVAGVTAGACLVALQRAGLDARLTFERVAFGGLWISRISLFGTHGGVNTADLVEPHSLDYARRALDRALSGTLRGVPIQVLAPEDFVLFKVLSTRERDLEDASTVILALASRFDRGLLELEAAAVSRETHEHDIAGRLARVLESPR